MIKPALDNFDTVWIKTSTSGRRTACIVKIEGDKHWKHQIPLADALVIVKRMRLVSTHVRLDVYDKAEGFAL